MCSLLRVRADCRSVAIDFLQTQDRKVVYFYGKAAEPADIGAVVSSLLQQLVSQMDPLPSSLESIYDDYSISNARPEPPIMRDLFLEYAKEFPTVYVVLDGFDDCEDELQREIVSLVEYFVGASINVLFTSRLPFQCLRFHGRTDSVSTLAITAHPDDIRTYNTRHVKRATS